MKKAEKGRDTRKLTCPFCPFCPYGQKGQKGTLGQVRMDTSKKEYIH